MSKSEECRSVFINKFRIFESLLDLARTACSKVNSVQEACPKCSAVHLNINPPYQNLKSCKPNEETKQIKKSKH